MKFAAWRWIRFQFESANANFSKKENEKEMKYVWYENLPQLAPVRPRNCPVSEFHKKTLKPSHLPSFGGGV